MSLPTASYTVAPGLKSPLTSEQALALLQSTRDALSIRDSDSSESKGEALPDDCTKCDPVASAHLFAWKDRQHYWHVRTTAGHDLFMRQGEAQAELDFKFPVTDHLVGSGCLQPRLYKPSPKFPDTGVATYDWLSGLVEVERSWLKEERNLVATCQHLADYLSALQSFPLSSVPRWVTDLMNPWDHADSLDHLCDAMLPRVSAQAGPRTASSASLKPYALLESDEQSLNATLAGLDLMLATRSKLAALPAQLTHGDINPTNIMVRVGAGDGLPEFCVIDFTPYCTETHLHAFTVFMYWICLYTDPAEPIVSELPLELMESMLFAYASRRKSGVEEAMLAVWPVVLAKVALRMVATHLVFADQATADTPLPGFLTPEATRRYADLLALVLEGQAALAALADRVRRRTTLRRPQ